MPKRGTRYLKVRQAIKDAGAGPFTIAEATSVLKRTAANRFNESVDIDLRLGVDPRHANQMVRGSVTLPHGTGKQRRVLVLANPAKQEEAILAGADLVGLEDYITRIQGGWIEFEVVVATPDVMRMVGRLGRILGPRGLMPNPKSGTVTMNVAAAVKQVKAGKINFRVDKLGNLHTGIGRLSFSEKQLRENARAFIQEVLRLRPAAARGMYVRSITLSSTMGPAIPVARTEAINIAR